ncbi:tetratricopeptide repeat-containing sensor histidine kinase [Rufibacter roseus]|uniref:histidine kinase n=1 Tax=Rufibacter roseus TaxID=1567108 RepID=A0ABW2DSD1_9BACT|nr:ATP-binding protein [Rufibacter roseus]
MTKYLYLLLFIFNASVVFADNSPASLLKELDTTSSDTRKVILLNQLCKYYWEVDPHLSISYGEKAIALSTKINNQKLLGNSLNYTSIGHFWISDLPNAYYYAHKALAIRISLKDSAGLITNYNSIGNIYLRQKKYESALENYQKALDLGYKINKSQSINSALSNIGEVYERQNKPEKALPIYLKVYELDKQTGNERNIAVDILNIGKTLCKLGRTNEGLEYLEKAQALSNDLTSVISRVFILRQLANAYLQLGQLDKAQQLALECLSSAAKYKSGENLEGATFILSQIYLARGDHKTANKYLLLHNKYQDSLQTNQQMKYFAEMHSKYESDKKDYENQQLRVEHQFQKAKLEEQGRLQYMFGALLILIAMLAFVFFNGKKKEKANNAQLSEFNKLILQKNEDIKLQKDELEKSNHQKDLLFSIIAHDLRGPLISLHSLLQLISMGNLPKEKLERFIQDLNTQQQNTIGLLDNLLAWAKIQMKGVRLESEPQEVKKLVQVNINLLQPQAHKKSILLQNNVPDDCWALVDEETIKMVFRNLLSNAIKYSHEGTFVEVTADLISNDQLMITVADGGVGISPENQLKLFSANKFREKGTANEKGNGLGLMLCKEFIERNGGEIWVESQEGKGTKFHFTVPACPVELKQQLAAEEEALA